MIRLGSIVALLLVSSTPAWAATAVKVEGTSGPESKVGREGSWRSATVGATIGETDFLAIPADATVRVTLPDGKVASFAGKIVVPGRRLVSEKTSSSNAAWLAHAIQSASDAVGGVSAGQDGPGASKPENVGSHLDLKEAGPRGGGGGSGSSGVGPAVSRDRGEKDAKAAPTSRTASKATSISPVPPAASAPVQPETPAQTPKVERSLGNQPADDVFGEENDAKKTTENSAIAMIAETPRTQSLRAGLESESEGNFETARTMLIKAAAKGANGEGDVRAIRAEALVGLGRIQLQIGNAKAASAHFVDAIKLDTVDGKTGPHAARAYYLLGIAALERGDVKGAHRKFKQLDGYPDLEAAAKRALSERRH